MTKSARTVFEIAAGLGEQIGTWSPTDLEAADKPMQLFSRRLGWWRYSGRQGWGTEGCVQPYSTCG